MVKLSWEVVLLGTESARVQASTMHKLDCGCDAHYTAVPIDLVESSEYALAEIVQEFQHLHDTMGCPRNGTD